eukprot:Opistho-1_new@6483
MAQLCADLAAAGSVAAVSVQRVAFFSLTFEFSREGHARQCATVHFDDDATPRLLLGSATGTSSVLAPIAQFVEGEFQQHLDARALLQTCCSALGVMECVASLARPAEYGPPDFVAVPRTATSVLLAFRGLFWIQLDVMSPTLVAISDGAHGNKALRRGVPVALFAAFADGCEGSAVHGGERPGCIVTCAHLVARSERVRHLLGTAALWDRLASGRRGSIPTAAVPAESHGAAVSVACDGADVRFVLDDGLRLSLHMTVRSAEPLATSASAGFMLESQSEGAPPAAAYPDGSDVVLSTFFATRVAAPPHSVAAVDSFLCLLSLPKALLADFIGIMRLELQPPADAAHCLAVRLLLTVSPALAVAANSPRMRHRAAAVHSADNKVVFAVRLSDPISGLHADVPLCHYIALNSTRLWEDERKDAPRSRPSDAGIAPSGGEGAMDWVGDMVDVPRQPTHPAAQLLLRAMLEPAAKETTPNAGYAVRR